MQKCGHLVCGGVQLGRRLDTHLLSTLRSIESRRLLVSDARGSTRIMQEMDEIMEENSMRKKKLAWRFARLANWKSRQDLTDQLIKNIVYQNDGDKSGLIGLNKPYGLPNNPAKDIPYSVTGCLTDLAEHLNIEKLEVVKTVDRYASGITLLAPSKSTKDKLKKVERKGNVDRQLRSSNLCLVKGHANLDARKTCRVKMKEFPTVENPLFSKIHKEPIIICDDGGSSSGWKLQKNQESLRHLDVRTLGRSSQVSLSLVTLAPSSTRNHFMRVWLADSGHPVLGDQLYDYRLRTILGRKVKVSGEHSQSNRIQKLSPAIMNLLGLSKGEEWRVPAFIHCWREYLPNWFGPGNHLTIYAPPPEHFVQALKESGISFSFEMFIKTDTVVTFDQKKKKAKTIADIVEDEGNVTER